MKRPPRRTAGGQSLNPLHCGAVVASPTSPRRSTRCRRFNPLHCGAVVASTSRTAPQGAGREFQSPSLRGSGRFHPRVGGGRAPGRGFNPLHCGAVVASAHRAAAEAACREVSIPFIAGQWSLRRGRRGARGRAVRFQSPSLRGSGRFLEALARNRADAEKFQSPSLRGSGRFAGCGASAPSCRCWFQSPSLRGSGRFRRSASTSRGASTFQSPSLRGSGRFLPDRPSSLKFDWVSIPFIAGQWSLQRRRNGRSGKPSVFQSPSLRGSGRFSAAALRGARQHRPGFNPLHCGAVVASGREEGGRKVGGIVSIPFIAGQWSLPGAARRRTARSARVSIPFIAGQWSLPGGRPWSHRRSTRQEFQSPSLRGSGRFLPYPSKVSQFFSQVVSIPFIAGQWSLPGGAGIALRGIPGFQSPSLRGSGRFYSLIERG